MNLAGAAGLNLLPLNDERLFIASSLARTALELGNDDEACKDVHSPSSNAKL